MNRPAAVLCLAYCFALSPDRARAAETASGPLAPVNIQQRIQQHRTALATVTVVDHAGRPLTNRTVVVEQKDHRFWFGCNAFRLNPSDTTAPQALYQQRFTALLNFATLPFYWGNYEPTRDQPRVERLRALAEWCRDHGLRAKGHPLCWHQVTPRWAARLPLDELHCLQLDRISREVTAFTGLIEVWDVVNEAVIMPNYDRDQNPVSALCRQLDRLPLIQQTFEAARRANPGAFLILNDYDTSAEFERLIEATLAAGVRLEAIGIQAHMHTGYRGADWAWNTCEQFARFRKPLHFTETTILSGPTRADIRWHGPRHDDWHTTPEGEQLQARQVEEFYRILFSHPAVEAITWWDFTDHAWLGAPAGLLRTDLTPKPAYERLLSLIKGEWWTGRQTLTTDEQGRIVFRGFLGPYALSLDGASTSFDLTQPGTAAITAALP